MKVCKKDRLAEQKMMMAIKEVGMTNNEEGKMAKIKQKAGHNQKHDHGHWMNFMPLISNRQII
jgi:hypothetical protein